MTSEPGGPERVLVAWRRVDGEGHAIGMLEATDRGWSAHGHEVLARDGEVVACHFTVVLDRRWETREVQVDAISALGVTRLVLRADTEHRWWRDGRRAAELDGCVDVDVAATPLTNTFPIRRLAHLDRGESATLPVAWVDVPRLGVQPVEQTYTRLGGVPADALVRGAWEYADPLHGSFRLTVDGMGVVVDYEGLAERIR